jgi:hypothetical protein
MALILGISSRLVYKKTDGHTDVNISIYIYIRNIPFQKPLHKVQVYSARKLTFPVAENVRQIQDSPQRLPDENRIDAQIRKYSPFP